MASKRLASELGQITEDEREIILNFYREEPAYADFILGSVKRTRDFIAELLEDEYGC